jgi:hypothetical protein
MFIATYLVSCVTTLGYITGILRTDAKGLHSGAQDTNRPAYRYIGTQDTLGTLCANYWKDIICEKLY